MRPLPSKTSRPALGQAKISRQQVARFLVAAANTQEYVGQCVALSG